MESENDSVFNDYSDENRDMELLSDRDDDLPPKQKRAFVKMLAKFIRCASFSIIYLLNSVIAWCFVLPLTHWHDDC